MTVPAWKSLPTWYLVAEGDQAIPPDAERLFAQRMGATTIEVTTNHVAMVSHPTTSSSSSKPPPRAAPMRVGRAHFSAQVHGLRPWTWARNSRRSSGLSV
jgi:hypothetical protein